MGEPRSTRHARTILALLALLLLAGPALAQTFPALSGRVVDQANILKPEDRAAIEAKLKAHEDKSSDQVVVATVRSLEGIPVEDYANRLYRHWQLGTKEKSNGALLLVAPTDRKVRIEVGYGLEGALTDALSGIVIRTAIAPKFKSGDFAGGIQAGVDAILSILAGDAEEWQRKPKIRTDETSSIDLVSLIILAILIINVLWTVVREARGMGHSVRKRRGQGWVWLPGPSSGTGWGGGSGWSGGSSGGGFSGGGGSSGGGGASGSW
ncbi:TPM domain-containing protein [uncultured Enterovirga sp.]|uniref:TPM domain-containing protein n=1 Tax=uncultured Enterovirga sp. TaxID=2026352 RepID=UPI0035C9DAE9